MRLIKVQSPLGKEYYINPACIEAVGPDPSGQTKIYMRGDNYYTTTSVEVVAQWIKESEVSDPVERRRNALLDPWQVVATTLKLMTDVSYDINRNEGERLRAECVVASIIAYNGSDVSATPLDTTRPL